MLTCQKKQTNKHVQKPWRRENLTVKWSFITNIKILISVRKAKTEWFSPSDISQEIFAGVYEVVWNLRQIKAKKKQ